MELVVGLNQINIKINHFPSSTLDEGNMKEQLKIIHHKKDVTLPFSFGFKTFSQQISKQDLKQSLLVKIIAFESFDTL